MSKLFKETTPKGSWNTVRTLSPEQADAARHEAHRTSPAGTAHEAQLKGRAHRATEEARALEAKAQDTQKPEDIHAAKKAHQDAAHAHKQLYVLGGPNRDHGDSPMGMEHDREAAHASKHLRGGSSEKYQSIARKKLGPPPGTPAAKSDTKKWAESKTGKGKPNTDLAEAKEHAANAELLKHRFGDFRVAADAHREAAEKYKQAGDIASYRKHAVEAKKTHEQHANGYSSASVGPYSQWKDAHDRGGNEGDGDEGGSYSHWAKGSRK